VPCFTFHVSSVGFTSVKISGVFVGVTSVGKSGVFVGTSDVPISTCIGTTSVMSTPVISEFIVIFIVL